jgi:hypothetical protein
MCDEDIAAFYTTNVSRRFISDRQGAISRVFIHAREPGRYSE